MKKILFVSLAVAAAVFAGVTAFEAASDVYVYGQLASDVYVYSQM